MTEAEALAELKSLPVNCLDFKEQMALDMAIEAMEKQIPKKPIENEIYGVHTSIFCPNCESELYCNQEYCDKCGQHLMWKRDKRRCEDD